MNFLDKKTVFSLEVFPPKDSVGLTAIYENLKDFAALSPDFISVTYGAGGTATGTTREIASYIQDKFNIPSVAHLICAGSTKAEIARVLDDFKAHGIRHVLALRGDLKGDKYLTDFNRATDLIDFINDYGDFVLHAACYPEGHAESANFSQDIEVLKIKNSLGVKHFLSQLFFDNDDFYRMLDAASAVGVNATFEAGIMPLTSLKQVNRIIGLSGAKVPAKLSKLLSRYENNSAALRQAGINYSIEQITDLITSGVDGIHLYAMNNPKTATDVFLSVAPMLEVINAK
jgi:5,10-methylenetetrahydrofolate reductase